MLCFQKVLESCIRTGDKPLDAVFYYQQWLFVVACYCGEVVGLASPFMFCITETLVSDIILYYATCTQQRHLITPQTGGLCDFAEM